jgi:type II secretory pathway pseudopilin PulG
MRTDCSEMRRSGLRLGAVLRVGSTGGGVGEARQDEQGFMLVGLVVAVFLILLVLSIAAPKVADQLKREREVEAVHRGNQFVRAIQLYYRKTGTYPATLEQLEKTNNVRYLRQRYVDPMTGKADWRLIHVGEAKTTVKGFFGKALSGLTPGLGSAAGMASQGAAGAGASTGSAFGGSGATGGLGSSSLGSGGLGSSSSGSSGFGSSSPTSSFGSSGFGSSSPTSSSGTGGLGSSSPATGPTGTTGGSSSGTDGSGTGSSSGIGSQSATSFTGSAAPFVGVGIPKDGTSIVVLNEQTTYHTWEFIYDPRIEQLKAAAALQGGGMNSGGLGSASGMSSGTGTGFGSSSPNSGFGSSSPNSGYGSSSGSAFGSSSPGSSSPTTPPTTPQQPPQ